MKNLLYICTMKRQIIIIASIFTSVLLLGVLFVAISSASTPKPYKNVAIEANDKPITFTTLNNSVTFTAFQIPQLLKILDRADIQAMLDEMYCDSNKITTVGEIDKYKFNYHYTFVNQNTKIHRIIVLDTIDSSEVSISRYAKFTDNLTIFRELLIDTK
jgi:hypothetical protein